MSALTHPFNAVPVSAVAFMLLMPGLFLISVFLLVVDLFAVVAVLRLRPVRQRLSRRSELKARRRAVELLGPYERVEWQTLDAIARRTEPFNPRRREVQALLNTFLNVALALTSARKCADGPDERMATREGRIGGLIAERREIAQRTERAIERLREQLETTGQLIRLSCDAAIAEQCESGAELWLTDVRESGSAGQPALCWDTSIRE